MKTYIALFSILVVLCGCGSNGSSKSDPPFPFVTVSSGSVSTVSKSGLFDLNASTTAQATVAPNQTIRNVTASTNAVIFIGTSSSISGNVNVSTNAILHVPVGFTIGGTVTIATGGQILYDSAAPGPMPISNG